jgi:hypothetical protein
VNFNLDITLPRVNAGSNISKSSATCYGNSVIYEATNGYNPSYYAIHARSTLYAIGHISKGDSGLILTIVVFIPLSELLELARFSPVNVLSGCNQTYHASVFWNLAIL